MCKETFEVSGLDDHRTAYEVEQYLIGLNHVNDASADFIRDELTVDYDETAVSHEQVVSEIKYAGCTLDPDGFFDKLRNSIDV